MALYLSKRLSKAGFIRYLNELILQFEDGQTLSLLQDGEFCLLAIRHLVPTEGVSLPRWKIDGHSADASHVGSDLPSFICTGEGTERPEQGQILARSIRTSQNLLFYSIRMNCSDNELPNKIFLY